MNYKPKFLEIKSVKEAADEMVKIGASGIDIMAEKAIHKVIKIHDVRNAMANIIKQECLSLGCEAAVNKGCINCSVEKSDVIIMATLKQYKLLIDKLKKQVSELPEIAKEIEELLSEIK